MRFQSEQQRLVQHNEDIKDQAKLLNFDIVDTFQMTMARYKDFLQGKCACHFHRVLSLRHISILKIIINS